MSNSKSAGIYSITSKVNGKRYIGSAIRICKRWDEHLGDLNRKQHHNPHLQNHYNKYGKDDLVFDVVEIVERADLSLQDFKQLLLEREQVYLDNWSCCEFNCIKKSTSHLGSKRVNAKNYSLDKVTNKYTVHYKLFDKSISLGAFSLEEDAIKHVEFIRSLSDDELLNYWEINHKGKYGKNKNVQNYTYSKSKDIYRVYWTINSTRVYFGTHKTKQLALEEVSLLKNKTDVERLQYYEETYKGRNSNPIHRINRRSKKTKGYFYSKTFDKWVVKFNVDGKKKSYGYYKTEEEAKEKANEVKKELAGFDFN